MKDRRIDHYHDPVNDRSLVMSGPYDTYPLTHLVSVSIGNNDPICLYRGGQYGARAVYQEAFRYLTLNKRASNSTIYLHFKSEEQPV